MKKSVHSNIFFLTFILENIQSVRVKFTINICSVYVFFSYMNLYEFKKPPNSSTYDVMDLNVWLI
jgi:hypothetical protein